MHFVAPDQSLFYKRYIYPLSELRTSEGENLHPAPFHLPKKPLHYSTVSTLGS